ncbi:MAG: hypothetical protein B7X04_01855 [Parcubacteria group bacterium 21-54-25]|nr:MAG: hypothetical protein B7X04_01855 [Parcubacteria group bacterium 21-54-25]HQU07681.1 hypothetical protein [Candidatus Paceibacterota bacterium]
MTFLLDANRIVFTHRRYRGAAALLFAIFFTLYVFILPARYTGGSIGLVSLHFITPLIILFAILFSFPLTLSTVYAFYAVQKKQHARTRGVVGGALGGILLPLMCCSPLLPSIAAVFAGVLPAAFGISGFLQGLLATYEIPLYVLIIIFLLYTVWQNAKQVVYAERGVCG